MTTKRTGRKYAVLIRYFTEIVQNEKVGNRVRMQAAGRLDSILERLDREKERRAARSLQDDSRGGDGPDGGQDEQDEAADALETPEQEALRTAKEILAKMKGGK